jgi:hypothetical protein
MNMRLIRAPFCGAASPIQNPAPVKKSGCASFTHRVGKKRKYRRMIFTMNGVNGNHEAPDGSLNVNGAQVFYPDGWCDER